MLRAGGVDGLRVSDTRHAPPRSGLAGGVPVAAATFIKFRLGPSIGCWRSRVTDNPDTMSLLPPVFFLAGALAGAGYLFLCRRVGRRFGWAGLTALIVALS